MFRTTFFSGKWLCLMALTLALAACGDDKKEPTSCDEAACNAEGKICDYVQNICVQCVDNLDCSVPTPVCQAGTNTCVACTASEGCLSSETCILNVCVPNIECSEALPCPSEGECGSDGKCLTSKGVACTALNEEELPDHAVQQDVDVTITWTSEGGWSVPSECPWVCLPGYMRDGSTCVEDASCQEDSDCTDRGCAEGRCASEKSVACDASENAKPTGANEDPENPMVLVQWDTDAEPQAWTAPEACQWTCPENTRLDAETNACIAIPCTAETFTEDCGAGTYCRIEPGMTEGECIAKTCQTACATLEGVEGICSDYEGNNAGMFVACANPAESCRLVGETPTATCVSALYCEQVSDCAARTDGKTLCDTSTNVCFECDELNETCARGEYCNANRECEAFCGNNLIDSENDERCDGSNLNGETCVSQGFASGELTCKSDCSDFDSSGCVRHENEDVVISQIYGGGGNSNAPWKNDYVELFNKTNHAINLTGWSIQYASASGASWSAYPLNGIIPAHGYFLILAASGGSTGSDVTNYDMQVSVNMSGTAGKVLLSTSPSAVTATACPTDSTIVDFVAYGSATDCSDTVAIGKTVAPSNTKAIFRKNDGCQDTNSNANDWATEAPEPRYSGSPLNECSIPATCSAPGCSENVYCEGVGALPIDCLSLSCDEALGCVECLLDAQCDSGLCDTSTGVCLTQNEIPCAAIQAPANGTALNGVNVTVHFVEGAWESAPSCDFTCDNGFNKNAAAGTCDATDPCDALDCSTVGHCEAGVCVANSKSAVCEGELGAHAHWVATPSIITWTEGSGWASFSCAAECDTNFHDEGAGCESDTKSVACAPAAPMNATDVEALVNIMWTDGAGWSAPASCSWACNATYHLENGACESNTKQVECAPAAPANATDIETQVTVTWTEEAGWNDPAICIWTCNQGYVLNATEDGCEASMPSSAGPFFSEYLFGGSNNKGVEIYNAGNASVSCVIKQYNNGAQTASHTSAVFTIVAGGIYTYCNSSASFNASCDGKHAGLNFNGNDALELVCDGIQVDVFGKIGEDPGTAWTNGTLTTAASTTLRRKCNITHGNVDNAAGFPSLGIEWDGVVPYTSEDLGKHCELEFTCEAVGCSGEAWCSAAGATPDDCGAEGWLCDDTEGCVECKSDNDCGDNEVCDEFLCFALSDPTCEMTGCSDEIWCSAAGATPDDCGAEGWLCDDTEGCVECKSDSDCGDNEICDSYLCEPKPITPSVGWCQTQSHGGSFAVELNSENASETFYGQVYVEGVTNNIENTILAKLLVYKPMTIPNQYQWFSQSYSFDATNHTQSSVNNQEYSVTVDLSDFHQSGQYYYTWGFSADGGSSWYYCELEPSGIDGAHLEIMYGAYGDSIFNDIVNSFSGQQPPLTVTTPIAQEITYTENWTGISASPFTSNDLPENMIWTYTGTNRTEAQGTTANYPIAPAILLATGNTLTSPALSDGVKDLSIQFGKGSSNSNARCIKVTIDGTVYPSGAYTPSAAPYYTTFNVPASSASATGFTIALDSTSTGCSSAQVSIGQISWTSY